MNIKEKLHQEKGKNVEVKFCILGYGIFDSSNVIKLDVVLFDSFEEKFDKID